MTESDFVLAARIAAAVTACLSVTSLTSGPNGTCATYGPGERILGVCMSRDAVRVHVMSRWGVPAVEVASEIREVLAPQLPHYEINVVIEDIVDVPADEPDDVGLAS